MNANGVILIRGADVVVTMDATRRELAGADVLLRGGMIAVEGCNLQGRGLAANAGVIEARGCVVTPGLVNTHHHFSGKMRWRKG